MIFSQNSPDFRENYGGARIGFGEWGGSLIEPFEKLILLLKEIKKREGESLDPTLRELLVSFINNQSIVGPLEYVGRYTRKDLVYYDYKEELESLDIVIDKLTKAIKYIEDLNNKGECDTLLSDILVIIKNFETQLKIRHKLLKEKPNLLKEVQNVRRELFVLVNEALYGPPLLLTNQIFLEKLDAIIEQIQEERNLFYSLGGVLSVSQKYLYNEEITENSYNSLYNMLCKVIANIGVLRHSEEADIDILSKLNFLKDYIIEVLCYNIEFTNSKQVLDYLKVLEASYDSIHKELFVQIVANLAQTQSHLFNLLGIPDSQQTAINDVFLAKPDCREPYFPDLDMNSIQTIIQRAPERDVVLVANYALHYFRTKRHWVFWVARGIKNIDSTIVDPDKLAEDLVVEAIVSGYESVIQRFKELVIFSEKLAKTSLTMEQSISDSLSEVEQVINILEKYNNQAILDIILFLVQLRTSETSSANDQIILNIPGTLKASFLSRSLQVNSELSGESSGLTDISVIREQLKHINNPYIVIYYLLAKSNRSLSFDMFEEAIEFDKKISIELCNFELIFKSNQLLFDNLKGILSSKETVLGESLDTLISSIEKINSNISPQVLVNCVQEISNFRVAIMQEMEGKIMVFEIKDIELVNDILRILVELEDLGVELITNFKIN